jgi:tRNA threonylcarbamoyladenosine biosynthesis protein TsaB
MILALHTGTPVCGLFVKTDSSWTDFSWQADRELADKLLGAIEDAVTSVHHIKAIIVYEGPGSYTGLRIGLTVANTLAESLAIPIIGSTGEGWREDGEARLADGGNDRIVMPVYGGQPHITTPRK